MTLEQFGLAKQMGEEATAKIPYFSRKPITGYVWKDKFCFMNDGEPIAVDKDTVGPLKYTAVFQSFGRGR